MRDYLTNLAARSLNPTPAIRPRLPSRFEPLREVGPLFPRLSGRELESPAVSEEVAADLVHVANSREHETRTSSRDRASQIFAEPAHPGEIKEVTPRDLRDEQRTIMATTKAVMEPSRNLGKAADGTSTDDHTAGAEPPPQGAGEEIDAMLARLQSANERPRPANPRLRDTQPKALSDETATTAAIGIPEPQHRAEARPSLDKSGQRRTSDELDPRVENNSTSVMPIAHIDQRARRGTLVVPHIEVERTSANIDRRPPTSGTSSFVRDGGLSMDDLGSPTVSAAQPSRGKKEAVQTEPIGPIINVTIGRVEVRAAAPATSPLKDRTSTSSSKLMSLDDYLRQRAEGGNR